jgi:hypothetical protein
VPSRSTQKRQYHEHRNAIKPAIVADYNRQVGHVDNADRMANMAKFHTQIFISTLSEICWHGLGMSHDHPCLYGDQPQLLLTSEDWTHVTISTGLATTTSSGVACSARGVTRTMVFKCVKCDVAFIVDRSCFEH